MYHRSVERECSVEDIAHAIEEHFIILVYEQSEELNKENIIRSSNNKKWSRNIQKKSIKYFSKISFIIVCVCAYQQQQQQVITRLYYKWSKKQHKRVCSKQIFSFSFVAFDYVFVLLLLYEVKKNEIFPCDWKDNNNNNFVFILHPTNFRTTIPTTTITTIFLKTLRITRKFVLVSEYMSVCLW